VTTAADADSAGAHDDEKPGAGRDGKERDGEGPGPHAPRAVRGVARLGLVARAGFYLLLAGLAVNLLIGVGQERGGGQANANGALTQVSRGPVGFVLLAGAALGFAVFGVVRIAGAVRDHRHGRLRRVSTAGQGVLYLGMAAVTTSFLRGSRSAGSEQQQRSTVATVIGLPFGRVLLAAVGLVVLGMCAWQVVVAVQGHFADSLRDDRMGDQARRATLLTARIGIPARALAVAPVGVFLLVAAVRADPEQAKGLDALLLEASGNPVGRVLVLLAAAGFAVFAVYSLLEARYRQVSSGA
jgi:hypothetical protein